MKKIFLAVLAAATTMNIMATTLEQVKLTMTSASSSANMTIRVVDDANPVSATLYEDTTFAGNPTTAYIYAVDGSKHYQIYKVNAASNIKLGIGTIADETYTITASNVKLGAAAMTLYDEETHQTHILNEGESFTFTAATKTRIEDRFIINPIQTEFVCQVAGGLYFHGDQAYTGLQVLAENGDVVEAAFDLAKGKDKFVAIADTGKYYILNGEKKIFFVVR